MPLLDPASQPSPAKPTVQSSKPSPPTQPNVISKSSSIPSSMTVAQNQTTPTLSTIERSTSQPQFSVAQQKKKGLDLSKYEDPDPESETLEGLKKELEFVSTKYCKVSGRDLSALRLGLHLKFHSHHLIIF